MSNGARTTYGNVPYGYHNPYGHTIGTRNGYMVPVMWLRLPRIPPMPLFERYFPRASLAQIQAALDTARQQLSVKLRSALEDSLTATLGTGLHVYEQGDGMFAVEGLGDPMLWETGDRRLLTEALRMAYDVLREATTIKAIVARIERNGVPKLRDVAVRSVPS